MTNDTSTKSTECHHEELIQSQSRKIERLDAELNYKRERLDDLKEDNKRMENKIDQIKDCMSKILLKSKTDDDKLQTRLTIIETELKLTKEIADNNRKDTNIKIAILGIILTGITITVNILHF